MKYSRSIKIIMIVVVIAVLVGSLLRPIILNDLFNTQRVKMVEGVLDASQLDFNKGLYELNGSVETYPNLFITPLSTDRPEAEMQDMPYAWKTSNGIQYGSYRFQLKGLEIGKIYGFYLYDALTSFEIFADGVLIAALGNPSETKALVESDAKVQSAEFVAEQKDVEIVIHVASQSSQFMGIWQKTYFGASDQITAFALKARQSDAFIIGAIFFMSIYVWILFTIMKEDKAILYFACICTTVTIKSLLSGQQIGFENFPILNYTMGLKIAYMMIPGICVSIFAFIGEVFKGIVWKKYIKFCYVISLLQAIFILIVPQQLYQETFIGYQIFIFISVLVIFIWAFKAILEKREGSILFTVGYTIFCLTAINDIFYSMIILKTGYYLSFGLFIMILAQAAMLAQRMQLALTTEAYLKQNLEHLVAVRTNELEIEKNRFENLSKVDSLTLLYNRGYLSEMLHFEFESYKRYHGAFSVLMLDLDHFKLINDTYGHVIGDEVLKGVSETLMTYSRRSDIVGRFGGEEFLIILRFTNSEDAIQHAEHLRRHIQEIKFEFGDKKFGITTSIGIACITDHVIDERQLIHQADEALYEAKSLGRNCVVLHE